jgi:hypothetical protein
VFWSFSRCARDFDDAQYYKADIRRRGIAVESIIDDIPDGPTGASSRLSSSCTIKLDKRALTDSHKRVLHSRNLEVTAHKNRYLTNTFAKIGLS